jgi:hypothetical protein
MPNEASNNTRRAILSNDMQKHGLVWRNDSGPGWEGPQTGSSSWRCPPKRSKKRAPNKEHQEAGAIFIKRSRSPKQLAPSGYPSYSPSLALREAVLPNNLLKKLALIKELFLKRSQSRSHF